MLGNFRHFLVIEGDLFPCRTFGQDHLFFRLTSIIFLETYTRDVIFTAPCNYPYLQNYPKIRHKSCKHSSSLLFKSPQSNCFSSLRNYLSVSNIQKDLRACFLGGEAKQITSLKELPILFSGPTLENDDQREEFLSINRG